MLPESFVRIVLAAIVVLAGALPVPAATPTLEFDLALSNATGLLDPGTPFDFTARLKGLKPARGEELVAVFESTAFPSRLVSFEADESSPVLTASTRLSSKPLALNAASQSIRVEVHVARLSGMRLQTVFQRIVYLMAGAPAAASNGAQPSPAPPKNLLAALLEDAPDVDRNGQPVQPLLPPDDIREENRGESPAAVSAPVYWKQIREAVTKRWQQELALLRKGQEGQSARVQFRLYPTGFAQLIQIERSSGNPNTDETALRTILSLYPFPPFPPDIREPSVDVHLDLPAAKR
jgi:TonB family protein